MVNQNSLTSMVLKSVVAVVLPLLAGNGIAAEAPPVTFPPARPPSNDITMENRVAVPMRDGVVLYADIYRPAEEGQYPVLVSRTPYSTERYPGIVRARCVLRPARLCVRLSRRARTP